MTFQVTAFLPVAMTVQACDASQALDIAASAFHTAPVDDYIADARLVRAKVRAVDDAADAVADVVAMYHGGA